MIGLTAKQKIGFIQDAEDVRNDLNGCMQERASDVAIHVKALVSEIDELTHELMSERAKRQGTERTLSLANIENQQLRAQLQGLYVAARTAAKDIEAVSDMVLAQIRRNKGA